MAKKQKTLDELFHETLKDIYYAEKKILTALPKMAKAAQSEELQAAFEKHEGETEGQVERLEQVFALCGLKPSAKTCPAIKGILEEGEEDMKEAKEPKVLDAGMIADAQAVEHYEIARYGTLIAWANQLGMADAARLFQQNRHAPHRPRRGTAKSPGCVAALAVLNLCSKCSSAGRLARAVTICAVRLAGRRSPA